jgi:hypothetical protein
MHYIDANGFYRPCCWLNEDKKVFWNHNIKDFTIDQMYDQFVKFSKKHLETGFENALEPCKKFCRKIKNNNLENVAPNTQINRTIIKNG